MAGVGEDLDLSVEEQLAQLRQQVVEDRASLEAAEKAAADREASAAGRAAEKQNTTRRDDADACSAYEQAERYRRAEESG